MVIELMRLYIRPGLSIRVVTALQTRLRLAMASGNDTPAAASPGRENEHGDRARSRSRAREGEEVEPHVPEEHQEDGKEEGEDAPEALDATKKGASRLELMNEVVACTKALSTASEDLSLVLNELKWTKKEMADGYKLLAEQMDATNKAIVTMGASITHQSSEISRMLRAFDKHAGTVKWALKANSPLEQSIQGISTDVTAKVEQLESRLGLAFENVSKGLVQLIEAVQNPPGTPSVLQGGRFPPPFPIPTQGAGSPTMPMAPGGVPGAGSQAMPMAPGSVPGTGSQVMPMTSGAMPGGSTPFTPMTPGGLANQSEVPPPPSVPPVEEPMLSSFIAFMPLNVGEQGPQVSLHPNTPTPRKGVGIITRDHKTGGRREISPTGYRHGQLYALTSAWCPAGLATPHNGKGECHRIYV